MASVKHLGLFPWCVYNSKQDFLEKYVLPFGETGLEIYEKSKSVFESMPLNLTESMALYWQVRKWRVTGFFQASSGGNEELSSNTINVPFDFVSTRNANSEIDLICANQETGTYPELITNYSVTYSVPYFLPQTSTDFSLQISVVNTPTSFDGYGFYGGDQIINNFVFFQFGHIDGENARYASWIDNVGTVDGFNSIPTTVSIAWLDQNISVQAYTHDSYAAPPDIAPILTAQASIEASEYWEYDPEDGGGPIYDKFTGAVLRPEYFDI
jgi:hypothetical protein